VYKKTSNPEINSKIAIIITVRQNCRLINSITKNSRNHSLKIVLGSRPRWNLARLQGF